MNKLFMPWSRGLRADGSQPRSREFDPQHQMDLMLIVDCFTRHSSRMTRLERQLKKFAFHYFFHCVCSLQKDRLVDGQRDKQTKGQRHKETERQKDKDTKRQKDKQTHPGQLSVDESDVFRRPRGVLVTFFPTRMLNLDSFSFSVISTQFDRTLSTRSSASNPIRDVIAVAVAIAVAVVVFVVVDDQRTSGRMSRI